MPGGFDYSGAPPVRVQDDGTRHRLTSGGFLSSDGELKPGEKYALARLTPTRGEMKRLDVPGTSGACDFEVIQLRRVSRCGGYTCPVVAALGLPRSGCRGAMRRGDRAARATWARRRAGGT